MHALDRPIWMSLTTHHAALSEGNASARRYARNVNLFASSCDDTPAAVAALADLVKAEESVFLLQVAKTVVPAGLVEVKAAKGVQMIAARDVTFEAPRRDILMLSDDDAPEMLALATLTEPGPFVTRTHTMGAFRGIRIGGRLVAMAGERMRFPGYTEVSGVCTLPEFRGRGLARCLSAAVVAGIRARGDQPFLHAWQTNSSAISLYEGLGFEVRTEVNVAVLKRGVP